MAPCNPCHSFACRCNVSASISHDIFPSVCPLFRRTPVIGFRAHPNPDLNLLVLLLQSLYFQIRSHSEFLLRCEFWGCTTETTTESYSQNCDLESSHSISINPEPTSKWVINIPVVVQRASWWASKAFLPHNTCLLSAGKRINLGWLQIGMASLEVSSTHSLKTSVSSMHLVTFLDPSLGIHSNIWEKKMCRRLNITWGRRGCREQARGNCRICDYTETSNS